MLEHTNALAQLGHTFTFTLGLHTHLHLGLEELEYRVFETWQQFRGKPLVERHSTMPPSSFVISATTVLGAGLPQHICLSLIFCRVLGSVLMYESE